MYSLLPELSEKNEASESSEKECPKEEMKSED